MITDKELAEGGYRFDDLVEHRIVSGRTDLDRKQKKYGFPKPVKTANRQTWFPKSEVHEWLRKRMALRDEQADPPEPPVKPGDPAAVKNNKPVKPAVRRSTT